MAEPFHNPRTPDVDVDAMFPDRWSPRAFLPDPVPKEQLERLFCAAGWAPSCYNEQPWLFLYAVTPEDRARFVEALVPLNQLWASKAPVLMFLAARRRFARNDNENRAAVFDGGAAWMALALQARKIGLHAHAMLGFVPGKAHEILGVPEDDYRILVAIAVGRRGEADQLPEDLREDEVPCDRKPLSDIAREGRF